MPHLDADRAARSLAATQHGVVSRAQLRRRGLSRHQIRNLTGPHGRWTALTDEVLRLSGSTKSTAQDSMAAVLDSGPGAVLSHLSAARWWGLRGCPSKPIHIVRTSSTTRRSVLAVPHRVRRLPDGWTCTHRGVPVVRPEFLALQLYAICRAARAERLVDRLWSMRLLSGASLGRFVGQLPERGMPGSAGLRLHHLRRGDAYRPPDSGLESRFQQIAEAAGFEFRRQVDSGDDDAWTGRVDFRHVSVPLIVEIQSEMHHSSLVDRRSDAIRLARLRDAGFIVVEITDTMVWTDPDAVRQAVEAGIDAARAS